MSRLPPKARLVRVVSGLTKQLPEQLAGLIEAPRFEEERAILGRLSDAERGRVAAAAMSDEEAAWMADLLTERWATVGEVVLDPVAAIQAPKELWLGKRARSLSLEVVVDGLDDGWIATWQGDISGSDAGLVVSLEAAPPEGAACASVRVRVEGRAHGKRTLLVDQARIELRVPRLVVSEERTQVLVRDQLDRPAAQVVVRIGNQDYRTDSSGRVLLDGPAESGSEVLVEGIFAGRIPGE